MNCFLLALWPLVWRIHRTLREEEEQSVGRCKILWVQCWNVCNSVSRRKRMHAVMPSSICLEHDAYVWRCWTYESHYKMRCKAARCTRTEHILVSCGVRVWECLEDFRKTPIISLWDGRVRSFWWFRDELFSLLLSPLQASRCSFTHSLVLFRGRWTDKQCGHPADEDLGSRGGRAWKNKPSRDCGHTEAGTGRNIYIYIHIIYIYILFRSSFHKRKKNLN